MPAKTWMISSSKLKTYMECPAQYYWRYVAKRPDDNKSASIKQQAEQTAVANQDVRIEQEPSTIFDSGKIVHRVLELAGQKRITNSSCDKRVTKKELLGLLESVASEPPTQDWQRPLVITPETIESAAKVLALCWKSINFPFTIATERTFDVPIGPIEDDKGNVVIEDAHVNGIIDRIDQFPSGRIKFVDYKSGWSVLSRAEAELDPQINLYLAIGKLLFPKAEGIDMELRYLNRGIRLGPIHYTDARKDWLLNGYVKPTLARMATWGKYPETPGSPQCYSCPRKSECASFASMVKGSLGPVTADMGQNLALYEKLGEIEGNVEKLKEQLKPFINSAVEKADDGEIFAGNHRARVIFRNMTAYHDLRGTAIAAAKAILEAKKASAPPAAEVVVPDDIEALKVGYRKLVSDNARLKTIAMESATAFEVASKIAKAQAGLVNDFVEALPEDVTLQVAQSIEGTATNSGHYMLEVERITIPFHDRVPNKAEIAEATSQEEKRKLIPAGSKPILDDSHEKTIPVEAVVVETPKAISMEPPKEVKAELKAIKTEPPKAITMEPPPAIKQALKTPAGPPVTMELFPETPAKDPGYTVEPEETDKNEPAGGQKAAWARPDCVACGGSGISSRGSPCHPCVSFSSKVGAGA